ncbi:MAG: YesL family protein [Lachnospiraceae bacterium]|nr:YesL family protein [Lachnospiraceae bacterium]
MFEKIFNLDGKLMRSLFKAADILWLNFLTVLLCVPVFSIGPALSALCYSCLKMARDEEGSVTKMYFAAFRRKFGQTVALGLLVTVVFVIFAGDIYAIWRGYAIFPPIVKLASYVAMAVILFASLYIFPMQARFENRIPVTIKNAFWASLIKFPKTLLMLLCWLFLPACILFISGNFTPVFLLFGLGFPSYFSAKIYDSFFKEIEDRIRNSNGED